MRTTLTLEEDVDHKIKAEVRKTGRSFKETVYDLLRRAFAVEPRANDRTPFVVHPWPMGLRPGYSYDDVWGLIGRLEEEERRPP